MEFHRKLALHNIRQGMMLLGHPIDHLTNDELEAAIIEMSKMFKTSFGISMQDTESGIEQLQSAAGRKIVERT